MKIGFPVENDEGLESRVYGHFGSAPSFVVVDTESNEVQTIRNQDLHHMHGACNPIRALDGQRLNALVTGGIGGGALMKLNALGVKVFAAGAWKVSENLALLQENRLEELTQDHSCKSHQGGCGF